MKLIIAKKQSYSTLVQFYSKQKAEKENIIDFHGELNEIAIRYESNQTNIYCGTGDQDSLSERQVRVIGIKIIQKIMELKRDSFSLQLTFQDKHLQIAILEGLLLGKYKFSKYKNESVHKVKEVEIVTSNLTSKDVDRVEVVCSGVNYARDLINENAHVATPDYLASQAQKLQKKGIKVTILKDKDLVETGLNLIHAVGQGSKTPPCLICMHYEGNKKAPTTAIVGKGVTFDSGGQNLKPTGSIETMRYDMAGAAAVLGTMQILSILKPSINVVGVIPATHNAMGSNAFFPGDVYKSYAGTTVEICSTDAEGRLILGDAIAYCIDNYKPSRIIDLATLTGGVLYALGELVAGLFSTDDKLAQDVFEAGEKTGDRVWRFPLYQEYCDSIKSDIADIRNLSKWKKGYASSITGAAFIKEFTKGIPWAHLDIAGTAFNENAPKDDSPRYATGFGVRLLVSLLCGNK